MTKRALAIASGFVGLCLVVAILVSAGSGPASFLSEHSPKAVRRTVFERPADPVEVDVAIYSFEGDFERVCKEARAQFAGDWIEIEKAVDQGGGRSVVKVASCMEPVSGRLYPRLEIYQNLTEETYADSYPRPTPGRVTVVAFSEDRSLFGAFLRRLGI